MASPAAFIAGAASGLDILSGLFGFLSAQEMAGAVESRARLLELEAEADAERYAEQARRFQATQRLSFLKAGVKIEGSALDVLDESARISSENLSAIRSRRRLAAEDRRARATAIRLKGRSQFFGAFTRSAIRLTGAAFATGAADTTTGRQSITGFPDG